MNIIKLNNAEFEVENYNKNTFFGGESISSTASCSVLTNDPTVFNEMASTPITSIQILHDGEVIYNLQNISARIESINEYLNVDRMSINIGLNFNEA